MPYIIAGLGNPGTEYEDTRHNTGRIVLDHVRLEYGGAKFESNHQLNALVSHIKIGKEKIILVQPETFMNKSGSSVVKLVKNIKAAQKLIVIYDDFNLPLGKIRISYNRSSGGHNGLESIIKAVMTEAFIRIRIGVAPENAKGNAKTPHGDDKIERFILGKYKLEEIKEIRKSAKKVSEALQVIVVGGREKAMSVFNAG